MIIAITTKGGVGRPRPQSSRRGGRQQGLQDAAHDWIPGELDHELWSIPARSRGRCMTFWSRRNGAHDVIVPTRRASESGAGAHHACQTGIELIGSSRVLPAEGQDQDVSEGRTTSLWTRRDSGMITVNAWWLRPRTGSDQSSISRWKELIFAGDDRQDQGATNPNLQLLGVVITMHDKRTTLAKDIHDQNSRRVWRPLFRTILTKSIRLEESPRTRSSSRSLQSRAERWSTILV